MPWLPIVHTPDEDSAFFACLISAGATVVAEVDGRVVGFVCTEPGWVTQLYVDPDHQGLGVGTALLATTADWPSVQLWTFADNRRARDFYSRRGFVEVEWTDGSGNEERWPDVRLVRESPGALWNR